MLGHPDFYDEYRYQIQTIEDNGLHGFDRYVALAVVARNIQILGTILWKQDVQKKADINNSSRRKNAA